MSQDATSARPGQATFAGWLIIVGSVIVVGTAWARISELHTLEAQEEFRRLLAESPLSGTGLGINELSATVRALCMVAAGAATAAAILGFQAMRRSSSARIVLTCLAPVMLIGGFATAGFFAPLVVAGIVMLWLSPTRDWFAGRPWSTVPEKRPAEPGRPDPFAAPATQSEEPPPDDRAESAAALPPPPPPSAQLFGARPAPTRRGRPAALAWACGITWLVCGLMSSLMVLFSFVFLVARDELFAEIERQQPGFDYQGLTHDEVVFGIYAMTAFVVVWCAIATVFAVFAFRGAPWGRIALLASAISAGLVCLALTVANPVLVLAVATCGVTIWLLTRAEVAAWFRR